MLFYQRCYLNAISDTSIHQATRSYEDWMRSRANIIESQLRSKHEQMREDLFSFFRATYYRWAQVWSGECADLCAAPKVLAVGDLHVDSFGTWRDAEGRLCWGVDDFDESYPLPYTNDLLRLATSLRLAIDAESLSIRFKDGCDAILEGYQRTLRAGGRPMVLAECEDVIGELGFACIKRPDKFWQALNSKPAIGEGLPKDARKPLETTFPDPRLEYKVVRREAGLGSLGQERFVAIAKWYGNCIAREAKAMLPSASVWLADKTDGRQSFYAKAMNSTIRPCDPYQQIAGKWLIRRLSPESNPIYISDLPSKRDEEALLQAMGSEAANVHLGAPRQVKSILRDLRRRKAKWLRIAAQVMAKKVKKDWKSYLN
jgi:Uncharacterized protein conserved in bacteria (DUF2252)